MALTPTPAFAVPYAAPKQAKTIADVHPMAPKKGCCALVDDSWRCASRGDGVTWEARVFDDLQHRRGCGAHVSDCSHDAMVGSNAAETMASSSLSDDASWSYRRLAFESSRATYQSSEGIVAVVCVLDGSSG
jgi:hypothetical protein